MPDNSKVEINGVSNQTISSVDQIDEAMRHLKIQSQVKEDQIIGNSTHYPDRPGEPDCIYYLRTGLCGYGSNCRFNHPAYIGQFPQYSSQLPQRPGQTDCQFFLKTGTCKFGATCKYHHPRDEKIATQVPLNVYGLPMRQDEKSCPYYLRTWSCKFGVGCKFHHPQPAGVGGLPTWSLPGGPSIPGLPLQSPQGFMPLIFSSSHGITLSQQRWNTYVGTASPLSSITSSTLGSNHVFDSKYPGQFGSTGQVSVFSESFPHYPDRPERPECQYYMTTGRCKFGSSCKYHHPKERVASLATSDLGPFGLPLRPGQAVCTNYSMYGICKFGPSCKFDHPWTGFYNYGVSMPTLSVVDSSLFANGISSPTPQSSETSLSESLKSSYSDQAKLETTHTEHQDLHTKAPHDPLQEASTPVQDTKFYRTST